MIKECDIRVIPETAAREDNIKRHVSALLAVNYGDICAVRVLKRSIDARKRDIFVNLRVRIYINEIPQDASYPVREYGDVSDKPQCIVVGAGPAGLFAALRLIELGLRPIIVERGKDVRWVIERYTRTVKPMYLQFIEPSKRYADIIIPQGGHNKVAINIITNTIEKSLRKLQTGK